MENTLKTLSEYQIKALKKGIDFTIELGYNSKHSATASVRLNYCSTGDIQENYIFNTTFSESTSAEKKQERLDNIKFFIETIVKENK